jgi:hypothetical protein
MKRGKRAGVPRFSDGRPIPCNAKLAASAPLG